MHISQAEQDALAKEELRRKFIFLHFYLDERRKLPLIEAKYKKLADGPYKDALFTAIYAMGELLGEDLKQLLERGHLLYCFDETKVFEVAA